MTKIKNDQAYPYKVNIIETDYFPGTDSETEAKDTVSYKYSDVRAFVLAGLTPDTGGVLKITEITYTGVLTTPAQVLNSLIPNYTVLRYHFLVVTVNGFKWFLKLQNIVVGSGETPVTDSDFIVFPTSIGPAGKGISSIAKTSTVGLVDTYTVTFTDSSTTTFNVTNGANGSNGRGITSVTLTSTVGLVKTYTITFTDATTTTFSVTDGTNGSNGIGISSIALTSTVGLVKTYTITFTNATTTTFTVTDGTNGTNAVNDNQKVLTSPADFTAGNYTLVNGDNDYTIFIENGATNVTITVPSGLVGKFQVGFIQRGSGLVTFIASGTTVDNPIGLKIKGTGSPAYLIQKGSTNTFNLLGNTAT